MRWPPLTSAEISLPGRPDAADVRERIAALAGAVDVIGLCDNHAGKARMSPLAGVALAREQGVATIAHVSCRDRNRLALRSEVLGAAALGAAGVLCLHGDPADGVPRVGDLAATALIGSVREWAAPHELAVGAVVDPFAADVERELRLLERKVAAGADYVQSQMVFDVEALRGFLERAADVLAGVRFHAGVALLRSANMAAQAARLPGTVLPGETVRRIGAGDGLEVATELAAELAAVPGVDALHLYPLGAEEAVGRVAAAFREAAEVRPS